MFQKRQTVEAGFVLIWQQGGGWVGEKGEVLARIFGFREFVQELEIRLSTGREGEDWGGGGAASSLPLLLLLLVPLLHLLLLLLSPGAPGQRLWRQPQEKIKPKLLLHAQPAYILIKIDRDEGWVGDLRTLN